jgi:hypothetical protein
MTLPSEAATQTFASKPIMPNYGIWGQIYFFFVLLKKIIRLKEDFY